MAEPVDIKFICKPKFEVDIETNDGLKTACNGVVANILDTLNLSDNVIEEEVRNEAFSEERQQNVIIAN